MIPGINHAIVDTHVTLAVTQDRVTSSNKLKMCVSATMWPLPTYKLCKSPLLCPDWMKYEFQEGGTMLTSNATAIPSGSPTVVQWSQPLLT